MAARSKARNGFARSNTGIVGLNPNQHMDVYVCVCSVFVLSCVGSGLATGSPLVPGVLSTVLKRLRKWRRGQESHWWMKTWMEVVRMDYYRISNRTQAIRNKDTKVISLFTKNTVLIHNDEICILRISDATVRVAVKDYLNVRSDVTMLDQLQKLSRGRWYQKTVTQHNLSLHSKNMLEIGCFTLNRVRWSWT
jgi:hypothetical protein